MRNEQEIKAKINYLTKVLERIDKRREDFKNEHGGYPNFSRDEMRIFSVLMKWSEKARIQIDALRYFIGQNELDKIERIVNGIDFYEITGGENLFKVDPTGFVIRFCTGDYLSGWSIENKGGKSWNKLEGTIYRHEAVEFRGVKEDEVKYITDNLTGKWEFEYIYE